jgi:hypothetical protein
MRKREAFCDFVNLVDLQGFGGINDLMKIPQKTRPFMAGMNAVRG